MRPPEWLDEGAQTEWRRLVPELSALGILTKLDVTCLACRCQAFSMLLDARTAIKDAGGMTYETKGDAGGRQIKKHPAVGIVEEAMRIIRAFDSEFGLTPSSRTRVHASPKKKDPTAKFLFGD